MAHKVNILVLTVAAAFVLSGCAHKYGPLSNAEVTASVDGMARSGVMSRPEGERYYLIWGKIMNDGFPQSTADVDWLLAEGQHGTPAQLAGRYPMIGVTLACLKPDHVDEAHRLQIIAYARTMSGCTDHEHAKAARYSACLIYRRFAQRSDLLSIEMLYNDPDPQVRKMAHGAAFKARHRQAGDS